VSAIQDALTSIRGRIGAATLIAVSKTRGIDEISEALNAGQRVFGENRVQEAQAKFPLLRAAYPGIELHLIGALQTNKALAAIELFDVIQTLDRPALAKALAKGIDKTKRSPRLYIEINIGNEPQKSGIAPDQAGAFLAYCRDSCGLSISGLMCIPPHNQEPRPYFKAMRELKDQLGLPHLSMGMSDDFEKAIDCGATEIRIGAAIFGVRQPKAI
jgi:pyridoxal phosphate enzyme (YggS family)